MTLESDKATLEVPAPEAGIIGEIKVKVGDKVSQGALLATWASGGAASAPAPAAQPLPRPLAPPRRRRDARRCAGARRFRMRRAGARRRARRLHRRLPRRRSRRQRGAGRSPADARRRLPQRRLHPVEGVAPRRQGDRRGGRNGRARRRLRAAEASISTLCAPGRSGVVKRLTTGLTGLARQRKVTVVTGEGAFTSPHTLAVATAEGERAVRFNCGDHRRRFGAGGAGLHPARSARLGLDRRARTAIHPEAPAGARRRRHRPGDGDGLSRPRVEDHRHRNDGPADAGRRPRHRRASSPSGSRSATRRSCSRPR